MADHSDVGDQHGRLADHSNYDFVDDYFRFMKTKAVKTMYEGQRQTHENPEMNCTIIQLPDDEAEMVETPGDPPP